MSDYDGGLPPNPGGVRDQLGEYRKAVEAKIALHTSLGETTPDHLLHQLAELVERERRERAAPTPAHLAEPVVEPVVESVLEHKAEEPAEETAVPRKPGRPRKPSDDDSTTGS